MIKIIFNLTIFSKGVNWDTKFPLRISLYSKQNVIEIIVLPKSLIVMSQISVLCTTLLFRKELYLFERKIMFQLVEEMVSVTAVLLLNLTVRHPSLVLLYTACV